MKKVYNIYFKNKCIYHSLKQEEFDATWKMISEFLSITDDRKKESLSYKEILSKI